MCLTSVLLQYLQSCKAEPRHNTSSPAAGGRAEAGKAGCDMGFPSHVAIVGSAAVEVCSVGADRGGLHDALERVDVQVVVVHTAGQPEDELEAQHVAGHIRRLVQACAQDIPLFSQLQRQVYRMGHRLQHGSPRRPLPSYKAAHTSDSPLQSRSGRALPCASTRGLDRLAQRAKHARTRSYGGAPYRRYGQVNTGRQDRRILHAHLQGVPSRKLQT